MALEYRLESKNKNLKLMDKLLDDLPPYVKTFTNVNEVTKSDNTLLSYTRDILEFAKHLKNNTEELKEKELTELEISFFESLSKFDIKEYERYLSTTKKLSNASIKRKLSSLAAFYKYLVEYHQIKQNPLLNYSYPKAETQPITYLTAEQTKELLEGVKRNDKKLIEQPTGRFTKDKEPIMELVPVDLTPLEKIQKEQTTSRDYALMVLFLGTGLRVSELVGIDLKDINFDEQYVSVVRKGKGMSVDRVYFGDEVKHALKEYLDGAEIPMETLSAYPTSLLSFCASNAMNENYLDLALSEFNFDNEGFEDDLESICKAVRNPGRAGFNPDYGEDALFLSSKGTRLSVRLVEKIIKEKVLTYLPDLKDKNKISPHKLRSTAATRLLSQTDNILLVSKILGHTSPAVTAKHYAELQDKKEKAQLASLGISDW